MNISIAAEKLFSIGPFPITNSMLIAWIVMIGLICATWYAFRKQSLIPHGLQNVFEFIIEGVLSVIDSVTHNRNESKQFLPLIATIFLFVVLVNWIGILPGAGTIGIQEVEEGHTRIIPFIRSTSADLNFTIALAIIAVTTVQVVGVMSIGFFAYIKKFLNFSSPLNFITGTLELVSEVSKLISFSFRLFGNVFAGEVLLSVMLFLVPYFVPIPFLALEVFVGFIQGLVFAMLTLVFVKMAKEAHHA
jgi:F-type H+-transporting ATPase subunit a